MIVGVLLLLAFVAVQGAVVVSTAGLLLKRLEISHWLAKIGACAASYVAWIVFTIGGYAALGGEGGLMDGFGLVLYLCFTALLSSIFFCLIWVFAPLFGRTAR